MKKRDSKTIRETSKRLGELYTDTVSWEPISGKDILLCTVGNRKSKFGEIDPNGIYEISVPTKIFHSAKKALKRAFKKKGNDGIMEVVMHKHDQIFRKNTNIL